MQAAHRQDTDYDLFIDSAALSLHNFYAGVERVFLLIASNVDEEVPDSSGWHRDLLNQMAHDKPAKRPAVLEPEVAHRLDEYLRFRHVIRNIYAFVLDAERIDPLVGNLRKVYSELSKALEEFAQFLEKVGE